MERRNIDSLISDIAKQSPESEAIHCDGRSLRFGELDSRATQLARHLREWGVMPGVLVGIYIERSVDMMVALLAVLKAGGAYVPLDPAYPRERIDYMLDDSAAPIVLTQASLAGALGARDVKLFCLDSDWPEVASQPTEPLPVIANAEDLAYVIYTSGSTGRPKGVAISQRALSNFMYSLREEPGFGPQDRLLAVTTLSFDIAGLELYLPLVVGAQVFIATRTDASDGHRLAKLITEQGITVMQATPASWRLLLEAGWQGSPGLRILCGGETLTRELAERLLPCCAELWNLYGPTETTIWSTVHKVVSGTGVVPIGHAIANTELLLLDENGKAVADGEAGELFIGGDGLASGYFQRAELTAERFIAHPHDGQKQIYRTGDRARRRTDGVLEHLGRVDFQVKVRGFRIELGEIEAVLDNHPGVNQSVVLAREDTPGDKRLVAYVVPAITDGPSTRELRSALAEKLPDYMIPGLFVTLNSFPMTPNGKVDRNALPAPDGSMNDFADEYVAPRSDDEAQMCAIWADVLRMERIGINDNFFELGGDSLKVAQVATRIREIFTVEMPLRMMFESPTVAGVMQFVDDAEKSAPALKELPITSVKRGDRIPLTFAQERVWFLHQLNPRNLAYNFQSSIDFDGELDIAALEKALGEILRRHESFRTSFPTVDGGPVQIVHPYRGYKLKVFDYRKKSASEQEAAARAWEQTEFQHRFDLAKIPLVRWALFRYGETRNVLMHMEHHLVHDGWSFNLFMRELVDLYKAYSANESSPLAEIPVQFAEFATWQRQWMQGDVSEHQLAYWRQQFQSIPPLLELPTKGPRPSAQTFRGATLRPEIPLELCNALRSLGRQEGSTLFMTMLAAFMALLHRYTSEEDVAIGTFFANRRMRESESLIGMILNNTVIRAAMDGNPTMREFMRQVRNLVLDAANNQDVPFDRVVDAVQPQRDMSVNPLFQVMFSFHDEPMPEKGLSGLNVKVTPVLSNGSAKFDLGVIGIPHSAQYLGLPQGSEQDGLTMLWEYNTDLFETETIDRMIEHYKALLTLMAENPDRRLSELSLMPADALQEMMAGFNQTATEPLPVAGLHQLFTRQAALTPDAVAVVFGENTMSYQQLDEESNRLSHILLAEGLERHQLVAICVARSERMLVGLLGILKAGGAYVPVDPAFPDDRKVYMLDDAKITLIVSDNASAADLPLKSRRVVRLDGDAARIAAAPAQAPSIGDPNGEDLCYVIYTSGSTGRPKGVRIPHRAVVNFIVSMAKQPGLKTGDRLLAVTTLSFDIAGLELYLPLAVGAQVIICPRDIAVNGEELAELIASSGATIMQATPTSWQMLVDAGWQGDPTFTVLCGGEALPRSLAQQLLARARDVWNMYGPTETTIWSAIHRVEDGDGTVPIGTPIDNTQIYVFDQYDNVAPVGVLGELCIAGAGVALGYLDRPELDDERFIANSVDPGGSKIYRTGDLARFHADGTLQCLGRTDFQIKLRGFRIELGEIESQIERLPGVQQAVVIAREDVPGDARLVAYLQAAASAQAPDHEQVVTALREVLPDYMVPSVSMGLESFPQTANGKIDRNALPAPSGVRDHDAASYVAPRNAAERKMQAIWQDTLGISPIGMQDDFFDIGGHSLLAVRMVTEISKRTGTTITLAAFLQGRNIEQAARHLDQGGDDEQPAMVGSAVLPLQTAGNKAPVFAAGSHPKYLNVARALGADQPFYRLDLYALQSQRMADGLAPLTTIEQFATHYVDEIRKIQPHGPYHLGGGCEGAYCAFEIALQLQRAGDKIGALSLWIPPPLRDPNRFSLYYSSPMLAARHARSALSNSRQPGVSWTARKALWRHEYIDFGIMRAVFRYIPGTKFEGTVNIVRTEQGPSNSYGDVNKPWKAHASKGVEVQVVPGSHETWFDDYLEDFVGILRTSLVAN